MILEFFSVKHFAQTTIQSLVSKECLAAGDYKIYAGTQTCPYIYMCTSIFTRPTLGELQEFYRSYADLSYSF